MSNGRPSMRDVAAEAQVSTMTVSRVLKDDSSTVSDDTRRRVLAAVEKLNYRRNDLARNLRLGRAAGLIGLVVNDLANPYYSELALGIEEVTAERDLRLVIANSDEQESSERDLVDDFVSRGVDGMIITPASYEQPGLRPFAAELPLVLVGTPPSGIDAHCALVDDFGGALSATRRLIELGHRRLGFIGNPPSVYTDAERFRGYSAALEEIGAKPLAHHVKRSHTDVAGYEQAARELLATKNPPSAIFCSNNRITLGTLRATIASGREVAVACFDDFEFADLIQVPLVVAYFDARLLGRRAAELLFDQIDDPSNGAKQRILIPTTLVERNT
jgi:LacI family transcriptional regulator